MANAPCGRRWKVATAADARGVLWAIENPASRRGGWAWWPEQADAPSLWDMPAIVELRRATAPEASMASFAGLAAAAASGMGRQHDGKTGEETSASESRLQEAYKDASVKSAIFDLQSVMLSEAKDAEKLAAFKRER